MQRGEVRDPIMVLVLSIFTCGVYNIIWLFKTGEEINQASGVMQFNMVKELLLTMVTCGMWGIWFQWRFAEAVVNLQKSWGVKPQMEAPVLFIMAFVSLMPFFVQQGLNDAWQHGTPQLGRDATQVGHDQF